MRALNGLITREILLLSVLGLAGWWIGDRVGTKVFARLNPERLRRVIYIGMIASGILMLV